jgi:predicted ATP-dependent endonuclease of OLD family
MKLRAVILENFRSYKDRVKVEIDDLTTFIGKNDVGKSTILEALEIFFNNEAVKIEPKDACVYNTHKNVRIGCVFSDLPDKIVLDTSAETTLAQEFLLNNEGLLEIHKVFNCDLKTIKPEVFAIARHPIGEMVGDLLGLNNTNLKKRLKDLNIDDPNIDTRSNVSIRQAIWKNVELDFEEREIPLKNGDSKSIWEKLEKKLPVFALFQSDRPSLDNDSEVQDPMKIAIKEALNLVEEQLIEVKETVRQKALSIAQHTLEKLREMDPNLANKLTPTFRDDPKWENLFKLSIEGDNGIPINKRGSGVRRLILLNFFRAEAERKKQENNATNVIYAIEEPETSQHPNNQRLLASALKGLVENGDSQVLLTTHVPGFAELLPIESIRYIKDNNGVKEIKSKDETTLDEVAHALGVLPTKDNDSGVKVLVCVEGPNDVIAMKNLNRIINEKNHQLINLTDDDRVVIMPLGGSTLKEWVENQYLKKLGLPEVHIYDRDDPDAPKYEKVCEDVNSRGDGSRGFLTNKREIENYIHPDAIKNVLGIEIQFEDFDDVPLLVAKKIYEKNSSKPWEEVDEGSKRKKENRAKKRLNLEVIPTLTYEQICEMDPENEIEGWFKTITNIINGVTVSL